MAAHGTHIFFDKARRKPNTITPRWEVRATRDQALLGVVQWWPGWRKFAFFPEAGTVFDHFCLAEISVFMSTETLKWKAGRKPCRLLGSSKPPAGLDYEGPPV